MNELEKQLSKLVEKGIEVAEQTGNFVIEQAPDLLQEFFRWHISKNIFLMIVFIVLVEKLQIQKIVIVLKQIFLIEIQSRKYLINKQ